MENRHTHTIYPLKTPNNKPKLLSIEPKPVQVTALPKDFPNKIVMNKVKTKIVIPKPKLFMNSDSMQSLTIGLSFGTRIIVITVDNTHFIKEIKLKEKPFIKHCIVKKIMIIKVITSKILIALNKFSIKFIIYFKNSLLKGLQTISNFGSKVRTEIMANNIAIPVNTPK